MTEGMSFDMPNLRLCQFVWSNARECQEPALEDLTANICEMHALMIVAQMKERGGAVMRRLETVYEEAPVTRKLNPRKPIFFNGRPSVVYYMKFGQEVKIGVSTNLPRRVETLRPETVLAIEPGRYGEEAGQHLRFANRRTHGEFFQLDHELIAHINMLRETYGEPMKKWAEWSALARAGRPAA